MSMNTCSGRKCAVVVDGMKDNLAAESLLVGHLAVREDSMKRRRLSKHEKGMSTAPLTVAITGASRGIGFGLAKALHERGDRVYGLCRSATERLNGLGLRGGVIENVDVTKDDVGRYLQDKLAGINIDVLVNNAGVLSREGLESFSGTEASAALDQARLQFEVNALGPLKVSSALLNGGNLKAGSNVVIVTSLMGSIADNGSGDDISLQLWHPGYIATDMTADTGGGGKRSVDDCILGFLELFDKMRDAGMEETGTFWHGNYGEGRKKISW